MTNTKVWITCSIIIATGLALGLGVGLGLRSDCSSTTTTAAAATVPDLSQYRWVDLTYSFNNDTIYWPNSPSDFELDVLAFGITDGGYFYSANTFCTPEHGGTHLDSPIHFAANKWTTEEIPLERLNGPGVVVDVTSKTQADADYRLSLDDVLHFEQAYGMIPSKSILLLRTGWGDRYGNRVAYLGDDTPGATDNLHFPSFGQEAARYLVEERKVSVLGVDTASIDYGQSRNFSVHQIANKANVPGLENVANLDLLPPTGSWIIALPMKIDMGSGGPARIVALLPF
mmetsp:Transcript_30298/g.54812  ORF Transcript_30298/g.54812 Transcript_30298/m.54812 type:complete len:286 (+) Transcript_30298:85-942(+)